MCEMRVMKPDIEVAIAVTENMWSEMNNDGVGIVAVYKNDKSFSYAFYKSIWYHRRRVKRWLKKNTEAWRWFIHCRNATSGGISIKSTHPIISECPKCSVSMLMHNGIMMFTNEEKVKAKLMERGHIFTGEVDSEMISHLLKHIPKNLKAMEKRDWFNDEGWTNWIAFNRKGILIHNDGDYAINAKEVTMKKRSMSQRWKKAVKYLLLFPDGKKEVSWREEEDFSYGSYGAGFYFDDVYGNNWNWRKRQEELTFTQPTTSIKTHCKATPLKVLKPEYQLYSPAESQVERKVRKQGIKSLTEREWVEYMYLTGELTYSDYAELMPEAKT